MRSDPELSVAAKSHATRRAFQKRTVLLYQGEAPRMAYIVKTGLIKMYSINNSGEEQIVSFFGPNDIFPSTWIFGKTSATLYYYETMTDCEVLTLPRESLKNLLYSPALLPHTLDYYINGHTGLLMRITALEQSRAREKILYTLYYLMFRYGKNTSNDTYVLEIPLTHKIIASLVGLTRETTSGEVSKLKRQKVLAYSGQTYQISKSRLERMLGEDNFMEVSL
jgi:CRP/FNR family transcriptional regulator, cyclic AMP receptor protein